MKLFTKKVAIFFLFFCCVILPLNAVCYQDTHTSHSSLAVKKNALPKEVGVGFFLLSGGKMDFNTSSMNMDFYLWLNYTGDPTPPTFEFLNSKNYKITKLEEKTPYPGTKVNYVSYRVSGNFEQEISLKNYPFDRVMLRILMEDTEKNSKELVYVPDLVNSGVDPLFNVSGWKVDSWTIKGQQHKYATNFGVPVAFDREKYSQIDVECKIVRSWWLSFIKVVGPALLFLLIGVTGIFLPRDDITKMSLCVASLFSSVAYHLSLFQSLPHINYLTFADKMMFGNYFIIFCNMAFIVMIRSYGKKKTSSQEVVFKISRVVIPLLTLSFICWLVLSSFFA